MPLGSRLNEHECGGSTWWRCGAAAHEATGGGERLRAVGSSGEQWRSSVALSEMEASGEGRSPPLARIVGDDTAAESAASDTDPHI
jgi:hypothetical protein